MKIFLDMDDVLVDFSGGLEKFNIRNENSFIHRPRSEWTPLQIKLDKQVVDCMNEPGFFKTLPPKEGFLKLWVEASKISRPYILTAWPQTTKDIPRIVKEKRNWVQDYLDPDISDRFICCAREQKKDYAVTWDDDILFGDRAWPNILIDDMESNITAWNKAGGTGILYKNATQAVEELKKHA